MKKSDDTRIYQGPRGGQYIIVNNRKRYLKKHKKIDNYTQQLSQLEQLPPEIIIEIMSKMTPTEIVHLCNSSPQIYRTICGHESVLVLLGGKIGRLPVEIQTEILQYLTPQDLLTLCEQFPKLKRTICKDAYLWKKIWINAVRNDDIHRFMDVLPFDILPFLMMSNKQLVLTIFSPLFNLNESDIKYFRPFIIDILSNRQNLNTKHILTIIKLILEKNNPTIISEILTYDLIDILDQLANQMFNSDTKPFKRKSKQILELLLNEMKQFPDEYSITDELINNIELLLRKYKQGKRLMTTRRRGLIMGKFKEI